MLNIGIGIEVFDFPESLANDLVEMFDSDERINWDKSLVGMGNESEIRTSKQFNFELEMPIAAGRVKELFIDAVKNYMNKYSTYISQDEGLTLLKYDINNKYDYHSDADWTLYRTLSGIIYLNPQEYDGGETHFKFFDISIKPEKPSIVLFPSNYIYSHAAMPVTDGTKYIFVTWMNDLPPGFSPSILRSIAHLTGK